MSEPIVQDSSPEPVQEPKKTRSPEEKIGRIKWNSILLTRILEEIKKLREGMKAENRQIREEIKQLRVMERAILNGFKGSGIIKYTPPMLQRIACVDAVDVAIVERVFQAAAPGILPKYVAIALDVGLSQYGLKHYHVSRRIVRMNKRLFDEIGECLFEKRGHKWALTSKAFDVYGETEEEVARSNSNVESTESL